MSDPLPTCCSCWCCCCLRVLLIGPFSVVFCSSCCIGYITYYNTPDNLRITSEDNVIEISAKNSENHQLCINTNTCVQFALQCNVASYVMSFMYQWCLPWAFVLLTSFSILQVWDELLFPISSLVNDTTVNLFTRWIHTLVLLFQDFIFIWLLLKEPFVCKTK